MLLDYLVENVDLLNCDSHPPFPDIGRTDLRAPVGITAAMGRRDTVEDFGEGFTEKGKVVEGWKLRTASRGYEVGRERVIMARMQGRGEERDE